MVHGSVIDEGAELHNNVNSSDRTKYYMIVRQRTRAHSLGVYAAPNTNGVHVGHQPVHHQRDRDRKAQNLTCRRQWICA